MVFNHECKLSSAEELIDLFQKHQFFRTTHISDAHMVGRGRHIYRGQANADWPLIPRAFRDPHIWAEFNFQGPGPYTKELNHIWLGMHMHVELRAAFMFLETADKLGIETAINYSRVRDNSELISRLLNQREIDAAQPFPNAATLEELALAQHHGVPTRLMDWSESPLIACFFAAYKASSAVPELQREKSNEIAVTCLHTGYLSTCQDVVVVQAPRHRNNFLRVQQGLFTHIPKANMFLLANDRWPSLEEVIESTPKLHGALKRYSIPATEADNLLRILFDHGITRTTLMPSLDNIAADYAYASKLFE